ncbi:MAG: hypothetical protein RIC38_13195 [Chromatocurvus sp.]
MWTYVFIAVVVALAVAPLLHFMPTRAQRRQSALRESAALGGLFVEFRDLPGYAPRLERMSRNERQVVYYGARLPARGEPRRQQSWWRVDDAWRGAPERLRSLPLALDDLPPEVLAASVDDNSCGVYWREAGQAGDVDRIIRCVTAWRADLAES